MNKKLLWILLSLIATLVLVPVILTVTATTAITTVRIAWPNSEMGVTMTNMIATPAFMLGATLSTGSILLISLVGAKLRVSRKIGTISAVIGMYASVLLSFDLLHAAGSDVTAILHAFLAGALWMTGLNCVYVVCVALNSPADGDRPNQVKASRSSRQPPNGRPHSRMALV